ncbi:MAG TPA: NfeD family protein [Methylomirabilota bacterium]|nr:NfeD family protein [Methylomirabilota bacterium]
MDWWIWVLAGLGLLALEMMTPGGFYVMFFGAGALVVGVLVALGAVQPQWLQWLLFSVVSVLSLILFRGRLVAWSHTGGTAPVVDSLLGEVATPMEDIAPDALGKAELRGTAWSARNVDARPLAKGQRGRVVRVDGLTLDIRAE